jgi:hypothetical protein
MLLKHATGIYRIYITDFAHLMKKLSFNLIDFMKINSDIAINMLIMDSMTGIL